LAETQIKLIRELVYSYLQSKVINGVMSEMNLPSNVILIINTLTNLDQLGFIQMAIAKIGINKFIFYLIWFAFA
jgi:hypothetical protein